jgi:hypothetical protein
LLIETGLYKIFFKGIKAGEIHFITTAGITAITGTLGNNHGGNSQTYLQEDDRTLPVYSFKSSLVDRKSLY